jgi:hypothetical protein
MSQCPYCGGKATEFVGASRFLRSFSYCVNCGWNAGIAQRRLRAQKTGQWFVVCFGVFLALYSGLHMGVPLGCAVALAFVVFPASLAIQAQVRLARLSPAAAKGFSIAHAVEVRKANSPHPVPLGWGEYYRLRWYARLSLLAVPLILYLLVHAPVVLLRGIGGLSPGAQIAVTFGTIGVATVLFCMPLLKWADWGCPRCGHPFAQPRYYYYYFSFIPMAWKLVARSHCAVCKLECGSSGF